MAAHLAELWIYPVKSLAGIRVEAAGVTARGLRHDRRFMVVDRDGRFVTQRKLPGMARVIPRLEPDGSLLLTAPEAGRLRVPLEPDRAPNCQVQVWDDRVLALDMGRGAADFLRAALGQPLRLVYMPATSRRVVDPEYAGASEVVSFADGFPFLILSQASLDDLGQRVVGEGGGPLDVRRFRPNLLVEGVPPYAEDNWGRIRLGGLNFRLVKPCARCAMTTVDPERGLVSGPNPLVGLAAYRRGKGGVFLGQNALVEAAEGWLKRGDGLHVLATAPPPTFESVPASSRVRS